MYLGNAYKGETISPFAKENDEEKAQAEDKMENKKPADKKAKPVEEDKSVKIDCDGLQNRIVDLPR